MKAKKKIAKRSARKKSVGQGKGGGRPTGYQPGKYPEMAKQHCLLGAIDTELANLFGSSVASFLKNRLLPAPFGPANTTI